MLATDGLLPLSLPVVAPNLPGAAPAPAAYPANFPATRGDFLAMNGPAVTALLVSTVHMREQASAIREFRYPRYISTWAR